MSCPFMSAAATAAEMSKCPMHAQLTAEQSSPPQPAVCPLGFGSSRGPKLSTLHCPVCKGLMFEAHTTSSCKHTFCHACISRMRDCPVCGRDVEAMEPNPEITGLVDTFLDTHSKSPQLVAAQADLGPLPDNSAASFFMAQGLKSLAGGNVHAALHRLSRCREALLAAAVGAGDAAGDAAVAKKPAAAAAADYSDRKQLNPANGVLEPGAVQLDDPQQQQQQQGTEAAAASQSAAAAAAAACQLAAVCGSIGDCYQRLGDAVQAEQLYLESISNVQPYAEADAEAAHAMSVSLNKLGDLRYMQQQLEGAKQLYKRALQLRQLYCGPLTGGRAGPGQQLELASSLIKVADVCRALGESDEAEQLLRRAQGVCFEVQLQSEDLPAAISRKLQLLMDVLHAQGTAVAG